MTSPFSQLLLALQAYINTQVPAIKFIDQDLGQLEEVNPPVQFPCLLIDFVETTWQQQQQGQDGTITVQFKLGFAPYENSSHITPLAVREDALEFYELEHTLYTKLQTWNAGGLLQNPLIRKVSRTEKQEERKLRVRVNDYECLFSDLSVS